MRIFSQINNCQQKQKQNKNKKKTNKQKTDKTKRAGALLLGLAKSIYYTALLECEKKFLGKSQDLEFNPHLVENMAFAL